MKIIIYFTDNYLIRYNFFKLLVNMIHFNKFHYYFIIIVMKSFLLKNITKFVKKFINTLFWIKLIVRR